MLINQNAYTTGWWNQSDQWSLKTKDLACKLTFEQLTHTHTPRIPHSSKNHPHPHSVLYVFSIIWNVSVIMVQVFYFQISETIDNRVFKSLGITGTQRNVVSTSKRCKFMNANFHCFLQMVIPVISILSKSGGRPVNFH